jgi:hypothetical protein
MTTASDYHRAAEQWPFITHIEEQYCLPHNILFAVGSRETGLHNIVGDHGHGHGVWQLDDRWHNIPHGFDKDPVAQAHVAAEMLQQLHQRFGDWEKALNAYNSGHPDAAHTTGHNYGPDVLHRLHQIDRIEHTDHAAPHDGGHAAPHDGGHTAPGHEHAAPHGHTAPHGLGHPHAHPGHAATPAHDHAAPSHAVPSHAAPVPAAPRDAGAPSGDGSGGHSPAHDPSTPVGSGYGTAPSQVGIGHTVYDPSHATSWTAAPGAGKGPHDNEARHAVSYDPSHVSSSSASSGDASGSQGNGANHAGAHDPSYANYDPSHANYDASHATVYDPSDASAANPHDQGQDGPVSNAVAATAHDPNQALDYQTQSAVQAGSSGTAGDSPHAAEIAQHASGNEVA